MAHLKIPKDKPLVCSVVTELQAAQVGKICQDYGIQAIINIKPFVEISQIKKAVKAKLKERLYNLCPCGSGQKFKFCCYHDSIKINL
ncbi:SEC-C metal-binding domain-containing protein [Bacillus sp. EB600]|uniref:SEC-C metal-binding domain-containing protein n=1 Tax=Bacillus sp. EB600 TaxID=2806345 RepID=UPI00210A54AE|nr:SEC-C metal-binding domain-containing protein [Bacillus sp. EB600]MCQ6282546.1 SEC-C domain-containing protein [Bacillus sp. EB600]